MKHTYSKNSTMVPSDGRFNQLVCTVCKKVLDTPQLYFGDCSGGATTLQECLNPSEATKAFNIATLTMEKLRVLEARISSQEIRFKEEVKLAAEELESRLERNFTPSQSWMVSEANRIQEELRNSLNAQVARIKTDCRTEAVAAITEHLNGPYNNFDDLSLWKKIKLLVW